MWLFTYLKHTLELSKLYWCSDHPSGWELSCVLQQLERKCSFQPLGHNLTWALGQFKFPIWSNSQLIDWDVSCMCSLITFHQISNRSSHLSLNARVQTEEQGSSSSPDPKQSQQCHQTEPKNEVGKHMGLVCLRQPCCLLQLPEGKRSSRGRAPAPLWRPAVCFLWLFCPLTDGNIAWFVHGATSGSVLWVNTWT